MCHPAGGRRAGAPRGDDDPCRRKSSTAEADYRPARVFGVRFPLYCVLTRSGRQAGRTVTHALAMGTASSVPSAAVAASRTTRTPRLLRASSSSSRTDAVRWISGRGSDCPVYFSSTSPDKSREPSSRLHRRKQSDPAPERLRRCKGCIFPVVRQPTGQRASPQDAEPLDACGRAGEGHPRGYLGVSYRAGLTVVIIVQRSALSNPDGPNLILFDLLQLSPSRTGAPVEATGRANEIRTKALSARHESAT